MTDGYFAPPTVEPPPIEAVLRAEPGAAVRHKRQRRTVVRVVVVTLSLGVLAAGAAAWPAKRALQVPPTIAGYALVDRATSLLPEPAKPSFVEAPGVSEYVSGEFVAEGADPPTFHLRAYRIPGNRDLTNADVLVGEFRQDANFPRDVGPGTRFPAGPLGGVLECRTIQRMATGCNWADGEVVGNVVFPTRPSLDAAAALTLTIRAAVQS